MGTKIYQAREDGERVAGEGEVLSWSMLRSTVRGKVESNGQEGLCTARAPAMASCQPRIRPCVPCTANMLLDWEHQVWRGLTHTSQSLAHGGGTSLPPRARKCPGLELPLIGTNLGNLLLLLMAAGAPHPPAARPCSRHAGFGGTILLPLTDVGLLELAKPRP